MNTKKLSLLLIGFAATAFFAGCQNSSQATPVGPVTGTTQGALNQESAADNAAFQGAVNLKDASFCNKITNKDYQQNCKTAVADSILLAEANNKLDENVCLKISSKEQQDLCKIQIAVGLEEKAKAELAEKENEKRNQIVQAGDYTACAKNLTDKTGISACELNILAAKAFETKEISWCDKISLPQDQQRCKDSFKEGTPNQ